MDNWTLLTADIETVFASKNAELMAERLSALQQCLSVLGDKVKKHMYLTIFQTFTDNRLCRSETFFGKFKRSISCCNQSKCYQCVYVGKCRKCTIFFGNVW